MKLTQSHATYWMERKGPRWVQKTLESKSKSVFSRQWVCIHSLIPKAHNCDKDFTIQSTLQLLKSYRKRKENLIKHLERFANSGLEAGIIGPRRAIIAKRLLRKIKN